MKIIILGASGQIGKLLTDFLAAYHDVVKTSRDSLPGYIQFDPFTSDWSKLGKVDALINCVGQIVATRSNTFSRVHADLAKNIIQHRALLGNPRIIQMSALGASINHKVEFLRTKGLADALVLAEPDTVIVRPSIVCTHRTMLVRKLLMLERFSRFSGGAIPVPSGMLETRIQPVMPVDLATAVNIVCQGSHHRIVNAVGPEPVSIGELIQLFARVTNSKMRGIEIPKLIVDIVIRGLMVPLFPAFINLQQYALLFEDNMADASVMRELLGRDPNPITGYFSNEFLAHHHRSKN